jgi:hypothetical protein
MPINLFNLHMKQRQPVQKDLHENMHLARILDGFCVTQSMLVSMLLLERSRSLFG